MAQTYIGPLPVQLLPNTLADATQVMADFNWIVAQVNANVPQANGGTYTNITLAGNTNNFSAATIIGGNFSSVALTTPTVTGGTFSSPALTGVPTTPTAPLGDNSQTIASTNWVRINTAAITGINLALATASPGLAFNSPGF